MATCMLKLPYCPTQAGYAAEFADGVISATLDGGMPFRRLDIAGSPHKVSASWTLAYDDYCAFMGFYRLWTRNPDDFLIDLILETPEPMEYQVSFVPGTMRLTGINGNARMVSAQLDVLPAFLDPCEDVCAGIAVINAYLGPDACETIEIIHNAVNGGGMSVTGN